MTEEQQFEKKQLKDLNEHNRRIVQDYAKSNKPAPLGVACPNCGGELVDPAGGKAVHRPPGQPPYVMARCSNERCAYTGPVHVES